MRSEEGEGGGSGEKIYSKRSVGMRKGLLRGADGLPQPGGEERIRDPARTVRGFHEPFRDEVPRLAASASANVS